MGTFIRYQETYSRGELLLRTFLGAIYIVIPHIFVLIFVGIAAMFIQFISFWIVLFTGTYPKNLWTFMLNLLRWGTRLNARLWNLSDGYPAIGLNAEDPNTNFTLEYPQKLSRGLLLLRVFFGGIYVGIPHGFCLLFLLIAAGFVRFITFFIVLFTAKYPRGMHDFMVGVLRWSNRVSAYMSFLTDTYPPFTLDEVETGNRALDQGV